MYTLCYVDIVVVIFFSLVYTHIVLCRHGCSSEFLQSLLQCKSARATVSPQHYVHVNVEFFIHVFLHLCHILII